MLDQSYYEKTDEIIEFYGRKASSLIPIMQDIQAEYRYLPGELLTYVARENTSLKSATEQPVMSVSPSQFWKPCKKNWDSAEKNTPLTICSLPWKRYPVSVPAVLPLP